MARIHYANNVQNWLKEVGIEYIKFNNAPAVPQARPIQRFWSLCKYQYSLRSKTSKTLKEFAKVWTKISESVAQNSALNLMEKVRYKLRLIGNKGVYATLNAKK